MNLRTYHAYTMAEALEAVKTDLGEEAVILHTRTFRRGGVLGIGAKQIVEVTAADALPNADEELAPAGSRAARRVSVASLSATAADVMEAKRAGAPTVAALQARKAYGARKESRDHGTGGSSAAGLRERVTSAHAPVVSVPAPSAEPVKAGVTSVSAPAPPRAPGMPSAPAAEQAITHPLKKWVPESISTTKAPPTASAAKPPDARRAAALPPQPVVVKVMKPASPALTRATQRAQSTSPAPTAAAEPAQTLSVQSQAARIHEAKTAQAMQDELAAIRDMVGQVLQRQVQSTGKATPGVPKKLFDMYLQLIAHDLAEEVADEVVSKVANSLAPDRLDDEEAVRSAVLEALTQYIPVAEAPQTAIEKTSDGRPLTIALVGPTGVGKTTTLAKLAASFKLHQKKNVGLVTCDTYRIAAVDQLTTYAKIIGVPLRVARTPEEMRLAVAEFAGFDVLLIDTAGRGQRDSERIDELREMIDAARPHEVHLVLSSTANEKVLLSEAEAFAPLGAEKIVLTKLDEAVSFGMLVNVLRTVGKRLSFVTTGQEVPDDFEPGSARRLAELVLGQNA